MHILKIIHGYPLNYNAGSEVYSQSICNELSQKHRVSVFTREENPYAPDFSIRKQIENENLTIYLVNNPNGKDGYRHIKMDEAFANLLEELKPDIAHVGHLNHLSTGLIDELNMKRIPIVFTLHDFWLMCPRGQFLTRSIGRANNNELCSGQNDNKCARDCYEVYFSGRERKIETIEQFMYEKYLAENDEVKCEEDINAWTNWVSRRMTETRSIIHKVDIFLAPSRYLMNRFIADFAVPEHKIKYLDYGFPIHYLTTTRQETKSEAFTFGYIGTHIPSKGINLLIEAFNSINLPSKLLIFGRENGQSTAALKQMAQKRADDIQFAGEYINQNLAEEVFSKVDCIVVPSIWAENSPLVIHEAQAFNIPVITADFGGMKEYVSHLENGLLFKHRDVDSLNEQMIYAINHPAEMKAFGEKGYLYSVDGKVPDIVDHCQILEEIYTELLPHKLWRITIDTNPEDCNLSCIMCEEHSKYSNFKEKLFQETGIRSRRLDPEKLTDIFRQAKKLGVREIIPSTMGEPLLYKGIEKIFQLSQEFDIKINLTTNGTFPKHPIEYWAEMIIPNTTDMKISWNGATAEVAEKIMTGLDFSRSIENTKKMVAFRDHHFKETGHYCRITFQLTFMQNNMHELADIVKLAAELGVDRIKGHHLWAHFDEIKDLSMKYDPESIKHWNQYVEEAFAASEKYKFKNGNAVLLDNILPLVPSTENVVPENYECPFLKKELWISATGNISPCCAPDDLRKSLGDFGNINETSILDVMTSEKYQHLVRNYKSYPLCRTCNMRKPAQS
jgi:glycosyltransferase involved in cell wall biosynthesis/MoaA/NifB/PqqE/SkfB family radical SAM enzyme